MPLYLWGILGSPPHKYENHGYDKFVSMLPAPFKVLSGLTFMKLYLLYWVTVSLQAYSNVQDAFQQPELFKKQMIKAETEVNFDRVF